MFGFPVPVSNKTIPRGWFAALVRFMNSLLLRGDGRYFAVTHTTEGTTIKPTPALIQALERSGGAAPSAGGGGSYGLQAAIYGGTSSIQLVPGSTASSVPLIPGPNVSIESDPTDNTVTIGAQVMTGLPDFFATGEYFHTTQLDRTITMSYTYPVCLMGQFNSGSDGNGTVDVILGNSHVLFAWGQGGLTFPSVSVPFYYIVPANCAIQFTSYGYAGVVGYAYPLLNLAPST